MVAGKQQPLATVFSKMNTKSYFNSDVAAAFGHARIPLEKPGHSSIKGLIKKYIHIEGFIGSPSTLRKVPMQMRLIN